MVDGYGVDLLLVHEHRLQKETYEYSIWSQPDIVKNMRQEKQISEYRVVVTSFFVDLIDVIVNLAIAILTGSVVMFAEFLQGLADLTSAGLLWIGHIKAKRRADKRHPFGHGKEIYFWTLISAVIMMTLTATVSFLFGLDRFIHPEEVDHVGFGLAALIISIVTNGYAFSLSFKRLLKGRAISHLPKIFLHDTAVATKNTFVLDLMGTIAAVFGLISLSLYLITGESRFDAFGAMVIGVATGILAFILIIGVKEFLIGKRASPETEESIKKAAREIDEVKEILDLRTMYLGSDRLLVNMEVHMKDKLTTDELENLIDKIKERVRLKVPSIQHIQVELETP